MKFRITAVDMDGYNGRDHHPARTDNGIVVTPIGMTLYILDGHGNETAMMDGTLDPSDEVRDFAAVIACEGTPLVDGCWTVRMWTCLTLDGTSRVLTLVDHEIEPIVETP